MPVPRVLGRPASSSTWQGRLGSTVNSTCGAVPARPSRIGSAASFSPSAEDVAWIRRVSLDGKALHIRRQQDVARGVGSIGLRPSFKPRRKPAAAKESTASSKPGPAAPLPAAPAAQPAAGRARADGSRPRHSRAESSSASNDRSCAPLQPAAAAAPPRLPMVHVDRRQVDGDARRAEGVAEAAAQPQHPADPRPSRPSPQAPDSQAVLALPQHLAPASQPVGAEAAGSRQSPGMVRPRLPPPPGALGGGRRLHPQSREVEFRQA